MSRMIVLPSISRAGWTKKNFQRVTTVTLQWKYVY